MKLKLETVAGLTVAAATLLGATSAQAANVSADYIYGTWMFPNGALAFLPDGTYVKNETGIADPTGHPGIEVGTYTFTPISATSGQFTSHTIINTDGDWGLESGSGVVTFFTNGGSKCFIADLTLCTANTATPFQLVNGWTANSGGQSFLAFLADGTYLQGVSASGSLETGKYSLDQGTGLLSLTNVSKFGGAAATLSTLGPLHLGLNGNQLSIQTSSSTLGFTAVPLTSAVPEPETYALMLAGIAAIGLSARRRNRS